MNTQQKRILAAALIGIVIPTAILIPIPKDNLVFAAYGFLLLAVIISAASLWQLSTSSAKNYLTGMAFPLALKLYLVSNIAMAVVFVALDLTETWYLPPLWYSAIQVAIIGYTAWKLLAIGTGQEEILRVGDGVKEQTSNWKMLLADTETILTTIPSSMRKNLSEVRDAIRYADPISHSAVVSIDESIHNAIDQLKNLIAENKESEVSVLCKQIIDDVHDRSNRLKKLK